MWKITSVAILGAVAVATLLNVPSPRYVYADKKPEPVNCVQLAKTWADAVEEAKVCNVPIIVHSHGFT